MNDAERMTARLQRNFDGESWHGTPLRRMLDDIDSPQAFARPIPNGRTIAELLAHTTAWIEIVERRVRGEDVKVTPELDFPAVDGVEFRALLDRLDAAFPRLLSTVGTLADLRQNVVAKPYSIHFMLDGLMHHNTYHAAQIAMLKKF
jgi:uncharacterized damage-inducible protein DinB